VRRSPDGQDEPTGSPGGTLLRTIRKRADRTQLWVEAEADIGTGYMQRIESGRVAQPERSTLERILTALDARYGERRDVLERFGYVVFADPPDQEEIAWAREVCAAEIATLPFPAYALDCAFRLIAWNDLVPRLFGIAPDHHAFRRLQEGWLLGSWFDPMSPVGRCVAEPERCLPAMVRAARFEVEQLHAGPWYEAMLDELAAQLPQFRSYWRAGQQSPEPVMAARGLVPVKLNVPDAGPLQFRLSAEPFARDPRFRLLSFFPADVAAMRWCDAEVNREAAPQAADS
jgi:transcriptional regulator with XRE-family HTH domain